ncbi:TPA: hypothetical protein MO340_004268 [Salmonella enterica subsp. salamae serovar 35:g,m,s,t:-]|nr:hypothetical protein [Salmonella enterica subsp. salamae serovar 35:g,m,s,t:-]HCA3549738.1 hypothetical protein [Salmonella enterica subsp. salamae serovar 35:g,m,s,t:-]
MRKKYLARANGHEIELTFSREEDKDNFTYLVFSKFVAGTMGSGVWPFVTEAISCGVDYPDWWLTYAQLRDRYLFALGDQPFMADFTGSKEQASKEKWRRYELCSRMGIATCESAHYPDIYELKCLLKPDDMDDIRSTFPSDNVFGRYIMACPPGDRLIDLQNVFILNEVWSEYSSFFIECRYLVNGDEIPDSVVAAASKNSDLRSILKRYGQKTHATRRSNEEQFIILAEQNSDAKHELRTVAIPSEMWCRMPPAGFDWEKLQSYRWLVRGLCDGIYEWFNHMPPEDMFSLNENM